MSGIGAHISAYGGVVELGRALVPATRSVAMADWQSLSFPRVRANQTKQFSFSTSEMDAAPPPTPSAPHRLDPEAGNPPPTPLRRSLPTTTLHPETGEVVTTPPPRPSRTSPDLPAVPIPGGGSSSLITGVLELRSRMNYRRFTPHFFVYNPIIRMLYQFATAADYRKWVSPPTHMSAPDAEMVDHLCQASMVLRAGFIDHTGGDAARLCFIVTPLRGARLCLAASSRVEFAHWTLALTNAAAGMQELAQERNAREAATREALGRATNALKETSLKGTELLKEAEDEMALNTLLRSDIETLRSALESERARSAGSEAELMRSAAACERLRSDVDGLRKTNRALRSQIDDIPKERHLSDFWLSSRGGGVEPSKS